MVEEEQFRMEELSETELMLSPGRGLLDSYPFSVYIAPDLTEFIENSEEVRRDITPKSMQDKEFPVYEDWNILVLKFYDTLCEYPNLNMDTASQYAFYRRLPIKERFKNSNSFLEFFYAVYEGVKTLTVFPLMDEYLRSQFNNNRMSSSNYTQLIRKPVSVPTYTKYYLKNRGNNLVGLKDEMLYMGLSEKGFPKRSIRNKMGGEARGSN
jgi:hypothetical protein